MGEERLDMKRFQHSKLTITYEDGSSLEDLMKIRTLTTIALLLGLSIVATYFSFPILPGATFLKIDFSDTIIILIAILFGFKEMTIAIILKGLSLLLKNPEPIGIMANLLAAFVFITIFYWIYRQSTKWQMIILACVLSTIAMTIVMCLANYFYLLPAYGIKEGYMAMIMTPILPFNLIKGILVSLLAVFLLKQSVVQKIMNQTF